MKLRMLLFFVLGLSAATISCSDDEEARKGDPDVTHEGTKWNIASVEYMLIDQNLSGGGAAGQTFKSGTKENAGTFYFVEGSEKGSFEMNIEGYNKEDLFHYSNDAGSINIFDIEQSVGTSTNQNIVVITGTATETEMLLDGSITKQSTSGQFILTIESITLVKQQ